MSEGAERDRGWFAPNLGKGGEDLAVRHDEIAEYIRHGTDGPEPNPKWPDWKGMLWVQGQQYELAGWFKSNDKGHYLSLKVSPYQERRHVSRPEHGRQPGDDEIPF